MKTNEEIHDSEYRKLKLAMTGEEFTLHCMDLAREDERKEIIKELNVHGQACYEVGCLETNKATKELVAKAVAETKEKIRDFFDSLDDSNTQHKIPIWAKGSIRRFLKELSSTKLKGSSSNEGKSYPEKDDVNTHQNTILSGDESHASADGQYAKAKSGESRKGDLCKCGHELRFHSGSTAFCKFIDRTENWNLSKKDEKAYLDLGITELAVCSCKKFEVKE